MEAETMTIKTSWDEVTLSEYLKISKVLSDKKLKDETIKKALMLAVILSNKTKKQIDLMSMKMIYVIAEKTSFVYKTIPKKRPNKPFKIKGDNYIFHPNFDGLTTGEMVSVETIIGEATKEKRNFLPEVLSILIRPCHSKRNKESKKLEHIIEPFDTDNLEFREALLLKELLVPCFLSQIEAFMTGARLSRITTSLSSVRKDQLRNQTKEIKSLLGKRDD